VKDKAPANIDGQSVLPTLLGQTQKPHEFLYWEFHEQGSKQAVRMGDWKAVRPAIDQQLELYDLSKDLSETNNVAKANPGIIAKIETYLKTARTESPRWPLKAKADKPEKADPKDVNYKVLRDAKAQASRLRDQDGRSFEIIEIPMPSPVTHDGQRLPATYVNFYFINGALLVPTYRDRKNDGKAIEILQSHLPKHKVIGIDCKELIWGLGAIHCLTQQQPKW